MNEQFNPFRTVPREEVESEHTFRSLRHFPEISKSISNATACIEQRVAEESALTKSMPRKAKTKKTTLKSTHYLDELCRSSLNEFNTLSQFRKQIINDRVKPISTFSITSMPKSEKELDPLTSGNAKLTKFAIRHDSRRANTDLEGFHGHTLTKEQFDYQLKHCLSIYLTRDELDALFLFIDTDKSLCIDGVEFLRYFFKLGQNARDEIRADAIATTMKTEARKTQQELEEQQRCYIENCRYKVEFTDDDRSSAVEKLGSFAGRFKCTFESIEFRDFKAMLTPVEFKISLEKLTNCKFSDREMAALLEKYGQVVPTRQTKNDIWCVVDGTNFVKCFIVLRKMELMKHRERELFNAESYKRTQQSMGCDVDLFPKSLGR